MFGLGMVANVLLWFYGIGFLVTIVAMLLLYNPKYLVFGFYWFQYLKLGITKKKAKLSDTCTFSYFEKGSRNSAVASVLLLHGLTGSKENFLAVAHFLPSKYHVIAVDMLGHGETSIIDNEEDYSVPTFVDNLKKFVDAVGLSGSPFHLIGMSFGGHVAGVYSCTHGEDLLSLTLICPQGVSFTREEQMIEEARRTESFILLPQTMDEYHQLIQLTQYKPKEIPKWILSGLFQIRRDREAVNYKVLRSLYEPASMHLLEKNLHNMSTPLLLVWGKEDKMIDIECLHTMKQKLTIPPRNVVVLDEVGHAINFERPRKLSFILIEFFNTFV